LRFSNTKSYRRLGSVGIATVKEYGCQTSRCKIAVMAADKQHAHKLIEHLAPDQVPAAIGMLERLLDPVARAIANAPVDDEPLTEADEKALAQARESSKAGKWIPHEEVLAEFGLSPDDLKSFANRPAKI